MPMANMDTVSGQLRKKKKLSKHKFCKQLTVCCPRLLQFLKRKEGNITISLQNE